MAADTKEVANRQKCETQYKRLEITIGLDKILALDLEVS